MRKAFLLVVLACVAGAAPAPAAEQAKRERILFSRTYPTTGGEDEIRAVAPAGGPSARLGHASFGASSPDASPDGTKIAFETSLPGHDSIYVMDSDGRNARRLLVDPQATMQEPAWSPNGRMIAYVRGQDLWVARADGTQRRLVAANGSSPTWSPDGRRIAFVRGHHIFVVSLAGGEPAQLTATEYEDDAPAWSPRGDEIAFERFDFPESSGHARLYVMNGDGSGQRLLLADDEPARHPSWSPDGLRLVFARGTFEQEQLYIVDANGLGLRRLTTSGAR